MPINAFEEGEDFLREQFSREWKKERGGSFASTSSGGDIALKTSLSKHAQRRVKERGVSPLDALKGTKKSGAILSDDRRKVITAIPEGWQKNAGAIRRGKEEQNKQSRIPDEDKLPPGPIKLLLKLEPATIGHVLGKSHSNIKRMTESRQGTAYCVYQCPYDYNMGAKTRD